VSRADGKGAKGSMDEATGFYAVRLIEEPQKGSASTWFAELPGLPQCHAVGRTQEEALANLDRTRAAWLSWAEAQGVPIPAPQPAPAITVQYAIRKEASQTRDADAGEDIGSRKTFEVAGAA
jgi:predicted RNase H-like HicB family nuclease